MPHEHQGTGHAMNELIARILCCPDCESTLGVDLVCAGCGRSFVPAEDGIISAMPAGMLRPAGDKETIQSAIEASSSPVEHGASIVLYEQAFHDEQAPHYDSMFAEPLPLRSYYRHLVRAQMYGYVKEAPFIVDLCCGTGKSSAPLVERGLTVIGMDVSRQMLRIYKQKYHASENPILIHADASRPPLRKNSCMAVSMIGGLHHIPDRAGSLQSCCDALSAGGLLILHEPLKTGRTSKLARVLENAYALTDPARVWSALLRRAGLKPNGRAEAPTTAADFTPYERPFTSTDELIEEMPRQMRTLTLRSQGALSFRQFAPYLQSSLGRPLAVAIVRFDGWLSNRGWNLSGDALFAVFRKDLS
jgi:ubiquinone/menaquinone biosynthesis C-methylase UbiE